MPDGYITYSTKLDNKRLESDLAKATKDVDRIEERLLKNKEKRLPIANQVQDLSAKLDEAKRKLDALQAESQKASAAISGYSINDPASIEAFSTAKGRMPALEKELAAAQKTVDTLQDKFDKADAKLESMDASAKRLEGDLNAAKEKAGGIADKLSKPATASERMGNAIGHAEKQMDKFTHRLAGLAKRVLVFTLIARALGAVRDFMGRYITSNSEAAQSIAKLKGALLTLAQPLLSVIIPAFVTFVNVLTRVISAVASFVSLLFGKGIKQSKKAAQNMYNEAKAISAAGAAADKAADSLAAFDEINKLSGDSGGGGGASSGATPDFDFDTSSTEADMQKLLGWIKLIGAALLAWKLSDTFAEGMRTFVGLILAINGAIELMKGTWDAWQNGVSMDNILQMLGGAALMATGLWIAFGKVGSGIGLIVSGLAMLATGLHDAMKNGWSFENMLLTIAGTLIAGLGISVLTGSWIPILIAGIAAALLSLIVATGHGEELISGIRQVCQGFVDFIAGIFTGDIDRALSGVSGIFNGLGVAVNAVIYGLRDTLLSFLDWLDEKTGGRFHRIIQVAKGYVVSFFGDAKRVTAEGIDAIKLIFSGLVQFIAGVFTNDWGMAWNGLKSILKGVINGILAMFEAMINAITGGLNIVIRGIKKFTAFKLPDWMGGYSFSGISIPEIPRAKIPRLATGAVIPPNREFLAVLGDQKSGTNIEAPLSTIQEAVATVMADMFQGQMAGFEAVVSVLKEILEAVYGIEIGDEVIAKAARRYWDKMAVVKGGA